MPFKIDMFSILICLIVTPPLKPRFSWCLSPISIPSAGIEQVARDHWRCLSLVLGHFQSWDPDLPHGPNTGVTAAPQILWRPTEANVFVGEIQHGRHLAGGTWCLPIPHIQKSSQPVHFVWLKGNKHVNLSIRTHILLIRSLFSVEISSLVSTDSHIPFWAMKNKSFFSSHDILVG